MDINVLIHLAFSFGLSYSDLRVFTLGGLLDFFKAKNNISENEQSERTGTSADMQRLFG